MNSDNWLTPSNVGSDFNRHCAALSSMADLPPGKAYGLPSGFNLALLRDICRQDSAIVVIDHAANGFEIRRLEYPATAELFYKYVIETAINNDIKPPLFDESGAIIGDRCQGEQVLPDNGGITLESGIKPPKIKAASVAKENKIPRFKTELTDDIKSEQIRIIQTAIDYFFNCEPESVNKYDKAAHLMQGNKHVSYSYLQRRFAAMAVFRTAEGGATAAIKAAIQSLIDSGYIEQLSQDESERLYNTKAAIYNVL